MNTLSAEEMAKRRASSRRIGWALGALVLVIYVLGMFIPR